MRSTEIVVIGGGASGMMAAIEAKRHGASVMILEKKPKLGKKLFATGNGKCNYTNRVQNAECYRSENPAFPWQAVSQFGCEESIAWFHKIGILARDRDGYIYPASCQAASVVRALEREIRRLQIEVHTEEWAEEIIPSERKKIGAGRGYMIRTNRASYLARKIILSTGGKASPVHGSSGDGYSFAKSLGHQIIQPVPALTSLILDETCAALWGGVRVQGSVFLYDEAGELLCQDTGELQMVSHGISGIPIFQVSRFAAREAARKRNVFLVVDSMPEVSEAWIAQELQRRITYDREQSLGDLLEGMFPDKWIGVLLKKSGLLIKHPAKSLSKEKRSVLVSSIKGMRIRVKQVSSFEKAQATAGGVSTSEVDVSTMESKLCRGLYLTGELLDVDGICGGYNLQWAWTTGYLAGRASAGKDAE